jgi:SAM-dependent methyltransferase
VANPASAAQHGVRKQPTETTQNSLAMDVLSKHIGRRRDCCVLDLGRGFGANIEYLSRFATKICVEDLYHTLSSLGHPFTGEERVYCPVFETLLPYRDQVRFDVIFLWNLLDYLDRDDIRRLMAHLATLCNRGALVYAMISIRPKIPELPTNFKIVDDRNLVCQQTTALQRDCPRYTQVKLREWMPALRVKRSFLLQSGIQEYLFEPA